MVLPVLPLQCDVVKLGHVEWTQGLACMGRARRPHHGAVQYRYLHSMGSISGLQSSTHVSPVAFTTPTELAHRAPHDRLGVYRTSTYHVLTYPYQVVHWCREDGRHFATQPVLTAVSP